MGVAVQDTEGKTALQLAESPDVRTTIQQLTRRR
jgi:hypothetical protein